MHTLLILAAIYGTLNAQTNLVTAPPTVKIGNAIRVTAHITEQEANSIGYKLVEDVPPICDTNQQAIAHGWAQTNRIYRLYTVEPLPPPPVIYRAWTPLTIMRGAKANGIWTVTKQVLDTNDAYDEFIASQYCAECDPKFLSIRAIFVSQIGEEATAAFLDGLKVEKYGTNEELLESVQ